MDILTSLIISIMPRSRCKKNYINKNIKQTDDPYFSYNDLADPRKCMSILHDVDVLYYLCSPNQQALEHDPTSGSKLS